MNFDKIEYSVCQDCMLYCAYGPGGAGEEADEKGMDEAMAREIGDKEGAHFVNGIEPTEDDPEGNGEESFSPNNCELCGALPGSRYSLTLLIPEPTN